MDLGLITKRVWGVEFGLVFVASVCGRAFGARSWGLVFGAWSLGLESGAQGLEFRVRAQGAGFWMCRIQGLGLTSEDDA